MGPDRTHHARKPHHGGNAKAGPSTSSGSGSGSRKYVSMEQRDPAGIPGVSKLKALIRQTRRFLAKDTLEPGLRITTERRLVSLEADLANAQKRDVEKKNGSKYHQVKFFEKRKLLRIIKRAKKALAEGSTSGNEDPKSKKKLEKELKEARIMLNYVRHYPNAQKYIALFPASSESETKDEEDETRVLKLPKLFKKSKSSNSDSKGPKDGEAVEDESTIKRRQVLDRISAMMESGSLPIEPELEIGENKTQVSLESENPAMTSETAGKKDKKNKKGQAEDVEAEAEAEEGDDFFDVDEDE